MSFIRKFPVDAKSGFNHILSTNHKISVYQNWFMQVTYQNSKITSWINSPYLQLKEIHTCHTITHKYGLNNAVSLKKNTFKERNNLKTKKLINKKLTLKINKNETLIKLYI